MAEISKIKKETEEKMKMAIEFLDETFARIRGRQSQYAYSRRRACRILRKFGPAIKRSYHNNSRRKDHLNTTFGEKTMLKVIEKALINSNIGITPENNGEVIRLSIPPLTEERTKNAGKTNQTRGRRRKK